MTIDLPPPILRYFAADAAGDIDALASCFTPDAVVRDEGNAYRGREAVVGWKQNAGSRYRYTVEPFALLEQSGRTIVASHLVGDFPGSPVDLRYAFRLDGDHIAELEIAV